MKKEITEAMETIKKFAANCKEGDRHIVVLDRGWIFIGDLSQDEKGVYTLSNAHNIRKWSKEGFGGLTLGMKNSGATIDKCAAMRFKDMIFAVPVSKDWENE